MIQRGQDGHENSGGVIGLRLRFQLRGFRLSLSTLYRSAYIIVRRTVARGITSVVPHFRMERYSVINEKLSRAELKYKFGSIILVFGEFLFYFTSKEILIFGSGSMILKNLKLNRNCR